MIRVSDSSAYQHATRAAIGDRVLHQVATPADRATGQRSNRDKTVAHLRLRPESDVSAMLAFVASPCAGHGLACAAMPSLYHIRGYAQISIGGLLALIV